MTVFQKQDFALYLQKYGINLNNRQQKQFQRYADLLVEWNQKMNLTAITEENAIYEKHFLDSILPLSDISIQGKLCDVGAGAGFPSIMMTPVLNSSSSSTFAVLTIVPSLVTLTQTFRSMAPSAGTDTFQVTIPPA